MFMYRLSWWEDKASIYAQCSEEGGGVFIYNMPISQEDYDALVPGTKIRVNGFKADFSGEVEIQDAEYTVLDEEPQVFEAIDATEFAGTDVYEAVKALEVGQTVDLEGFLYWYEGANPHITSVTVK